MLPTRSVSAPNSTSCNEVVSESDSVKYFSNSPGCSAVPVISSPDRRVMEMKPESFRIRSNCSTASMNFVAVSSFTSLGMMLPRQRVVKFDCIRIRSLVVFVRNR